jgi:hypothetical protein
VSDLVKAGNIVALSAEKGAKPPQNVSTLVRHTEASAKQILAYKVTSAQEKQWAVDSLVWAGDALKQLERERKSATDPIMKGVETIRGWFKPAELALEEASRHLRKALGEYETKAREHNLVAMNSPTVAMVAVAEDPRVRNVEDVSIEILNRDLVPQALCSPDEARIRLFHKLHPDCQIPGVRLTKLTKVVRVGGRRKA